MLQTLWIALFGAVGVLARHFADRTAVGLWGMESQWAATFLVNALGCFLAGVIWILAVEKMMLPTDLRIALLVGFAGGFTTFSAYALQSFQLWEARQWSVLATVWIGSPIVGLTMLLAGVKLARLI
jgi:CrcB protein